jgi:hypothetical protein
MWRGLLGERMTDTLEAKEMPEVGVVVAGVKISQKW